MLMILVTVLIPERKSLAFEEKFERRAEQRKSVGK